MAEFFISPMKGFCDWCYRGVLSNEAQVHVRDTDKRAMKHGKSRDTFLCGDCYRTDIFRATKRTWAVVRFPPDA